MSPAQNVPIAMVILFIAVVQSAPPIQMTLKDASNLENNDQASTSPTNSPILVSTEEKPEEETVFGSLAPTVPIKIGTIEARRTGKLLGLELGLGVGLGYGGYGGYGYGGAPFPCPTYRLATLGFPYYNPSCYGYSVPSFPYYGGVLG